MSRAWRTVRVFISSTFRDMHAERDHLVKVVFPALRERLAAYRVYLVDVDLRWGVTREQAENDQVTELCLMLAGECDVFLGLLGERYGWVPSAHHQAVPDDYPWVTEHRGASVTELEMLHGALNPPPQRPAVFGFRDPHAVAAVPEPSRSAVFVETESDSRRRLTDLKERIRRSDFPVMDPYPAHWDASRGRLVDLEAFGERLREELWQAVRKVLALPETPPAEKAADPLAEEADYHERFMESRLRVYVGREEVRRSLTDFADGDAAMPCLVTGPSGSGKSAALARFVTEYRQAHPQTLLLAHFVGASPRSTGLRDLLRRFCLVLKGRFGLADEVPEETARLMVAFREFLGKVPADERLLLVIDALNQLDETDRAQHLEWLPARLPPHVKVVVSCIADPDRPEPVLEAFRPRPHRSMPVEPLRDEERREIIKQVPSLSAKALDEQQITLLLANPATANPLFLLVALEELRGFGSFERLNDKIAALPREGDTVTALFTQVIERLEEEFDEAVVRTVLTLLASARRGLSDRELLDLVEGPGVSITASQGDLFPVLRQLRPYLLSRAGLNDFYHRNLFKAVRDRYLDTSEKQRAVHARLADYFHGRDQPLPRERPGFAERLTTWVTGFFQWFLERHPGSTSSPVEGDDGQEFWVESLAEQRERSRRFPPTPRPANQRRVDELPWQRLRAEQWGELEALLTDLSFLEAKAEAGLVLDLIADFANVVKGLPPGKGRRTLELLEEALRQDLHFLARHPTTLFQCLWNLCWWYDCPAAAGHYEERRAPGQAAGVELFRLLERWRQDKEKRTPGFVWVRSMRPPPQHLGTALKAIFKGHTVEVGGVAFSPDGARVASGSTDKTVRLWDVASGAQLACLEGHAEGVQCVAFSPDGSRLATGSWDQSIRLWDTQSGAQLACLQGETGLVSSVAFSPNGMTLASASFKEVRLWDAQTGQQLTCLQGHTHAVTGVAFSPDGRRIVTGSVDKTVRLWDAQTGRQLACLQGHTGKVYGVAFSPDGTRVASGAEDHVVGSDNTIRLWDVQSGRQLACLKGHADAVWSVAFSTDGTRVASGSFDKTVRLWDAHTGVALACLRGHADGVKSVAFSPDGSRIVSGSSDNTVWLWDAQRGQSQVTLQGHTNWVSKVAFMPDEGRLVSSSLDKMVRLWDARTGECLEVRKGGINPITDVEAVYPPAAHPSTRRRRWYADEDVLETRFVVAATKQLIAWLAWPLGKYKTETFDRTFAGSFGDYLALITLEGDLPAEGETPA